MAEKVLNTRIQLKYDTLANWTASSFKLKAGELAIVTLGNVVDGSAGKANQHPVLFKVGTGEHTFSELPYASALAADVYAWAKASDVVLEGKTINFKNGDNVVKSIVLNYITEAEANTLISNALKSYSTTEEMNAAIKVEADRAKAAEEALGDRIDAFNLPEGGFASKSEFDALKGKVEDEDGALARANAAYTLAESKVATSDFETFKTSNTKAIADAQAAAEGKVTELANGAVKDNADAIDILEGRMDDAEAALGTVDSRIEAAITGADLGQYALDSDLDAAVERIVDLETADGVQDGLLAGLRTDVDLKAAQADLTTEVNRAKGEEARLEGLVTAEATTAREEEGKLNTRLLKVETFFETAEGESLDTALDTLVEIQKYLDGEGEVADQMLLDIAANTKAIEDEAARADAEEKRLAGLINTNAQNIAALGVTDGKVAAAQKADEASSLDAAGIAQVQGIKVNNAGTADVANSLSDSAKAEVKKVKVDNATNADKLGGVVAADYLLKSEAPGYDDILTKTAAVAGYQPKGNYASAEQGAKADTAVQPAALNNYYTKTEADAAFMDSTETGSAIDAKISALKLATTYEPIGAENRAKAYTDSLASNYATAAQGAKADSALQSIEAGTGLKVSAKAENKQTIDIDESVVFVFDCGSATKLID